MAMQRFLDEEHRMLRNAVREFVEKELMPEAKELDEKGEFPWHVFRKAAKLGYIGASLPEEYGGAGTDYLSEAIITEEFMRAGSPGAVVTATLGCIPVFYFGSEEQKERYLPVVTSGKGVSGIAITEPNAGSDVAAIQTSAVKRGGKWVLNGSKEFTTNGNIASWLVIAAKTDKTAQPAYKGISNFIVELPTEGFSASLISKMGMHCSPTASISLRDVEVPAENLLGAENMGFYQIAMFFNVSRVFTAAAALGLAQRCYELALEYAKQREAFGKPIAAFQEIQFKLANMWTEIQAARLLVWHAAKLIDMNQPDAAFSSAAKVYATEVANKVAYEAVQIHGGYGYSKEYDVERYYRDARMFTIVEGTSEIQRLILGRFLTGRLRF